MALPNKKIKSIKIPTDSDPYEIIPDRLQNSGYELKPPTLTQDSTIALTSDIPPQEMYWCTYSTTTYAQISQALSDGKVPMIKYNGITYMYSKDWGSSLGHLFGTMDGNFARWVYCKQNSTWGTGYMEVENSVNKTTTISSASTNVQYPSAKAVWDALPTDTNQKVKTGNVTFGADDVVDFVAGSNVSIVGDASAKTITINSTASSVKTLNTTATLSQSTSSNEAISGTGTITLHKISKTGSYGDLLNKPTYSSMPYGSTTKYIIYGSSGTSSNPIPFIGSGQCYIQQDGGSTYLYSNNKQVLTSHQNIKSLDTTATTAQTTSASEDVKGSGTLTLHKVSKTGTYSDLIGTPDLSSLHTHSNKTALDNFVVTSTSVTDGTNTFNLPANVSAFTNDSGYLTSSALSDYVPTSRTVNSKALSSNITLSYSDVKALPNFNLNISHQTAGNPRPVKFLTINYATAATYFKMSATSCHDNGTSYQFLEDIIIGCTTSGSVVCNVYKYCQQTVTYDSATRNYGDVFYVIDTTNKKVDFFILCGQWASSQFTPATKIGNTTIAYITQYTGTATYYSSGTKVWANGNSTTYAKLSDVPTNYIPLSGSSAITGSLTPNAASNSQTLGTSSKMWNAIYGTNFYSSSDKRLKENIKDVELDCSRVIKDIELKEFNFIDDKEKKVVVGAIAQQLDEILPERYKKELISGNEDSYYSINESKLVYIVIGALKEEQKKNKELEERISNLEKRLGDK